MSQPLSGLLGLPEPDMPSYSVGVGPGAVGTGGCQEMRWPWRKDWSVQLVGLWSGERTPLPFLRFWSREQAQAWINDQESGKPANTMSRYEPVRLPSGR